MLAAPLDHCFADGPADWPFRAPNGPAPRRAPSDGRRSGGLRLHVRHRYASGLIASGCDVVTVQRALGHASANTTLATYSHLWPDADDRTRTAVEHLMAAALQDPADLVRTNGDPQAADLRK